MRRRRKSLLVKGFAFAETPLAANVDRDGPALDGFPVSKTLVIVSCKWANGQGGWVGDVRMFNIMLGRLPSWSQTCTIISSKLKLVD